MKSKIILISGYPATGKSTFSAKLSEALKIPCFNKDLLKEAMADGFGKDSTDVWHKGSVATFSVMHHIAKCFLKVGKSCILESNFRPSEGEELERLIKKYNADCLTYLFSCDPDVIYKRYVNRDDAGERHWVHKTVNELGHDFVAYCVNNKIGQIEVGEVVKVDATDFEKVDFNALIAKAVE